MDWAGVSAQELLIALREVRALRCALRGTLSAPVSKLALTQPRASVALAGGLEPEAETSGRCAAAAGCLAAARADRAAAEFFTRFTPPKSRTKWTSRLKCNGARPRRGARAACALTLPTRAAYYYRVNYFCVAVLLFVGAFVRHPLAFFAVGAAAFTTLCLNDSFSHAVRRARALLQRAALTLTAHARASPARSDRVVRTARKLHPPLAAKLRNPTATCVALPGRAASPR